MASPSAALTIRKLEETVKSQLRMQAAAHGRSMEEEAREILKNALNKSGIEPADPAASVRQRFTAIGGVELPVTNKREEIRPEPDFRK
jgi:plasmid stability protein